MLCEGDAKSYCDFDVNKNFCADVLMCGQDDPFVPYDGMWYGRDDRGTVTTTVPIIGGVYLRALSPMAFSALPNVRPVFGYFNANSTEMLACDRTGACFLLLRAYV